MLVNTFSGEPLVNLLPDGRTIRLAERFGFCDSSGREWWGEVGDIANGTSYPRPLWSLSGGPWSTKSRWGAIIHDIECAKRVNPWQEVHNMFGEAILICGVSQDRATIEFNMVWRFGPRWDENGITIKSTEWEDSDDITEEFINGYDKNLV